MTHTSGEWRIELGYADYVAIEAYFEDDDAWWPITFIELDDHGENPTEEQLANARLISAAPAMLEACEYALAFCRSINNIDYDYESTLGDVEDLLYVAIAKARPE